MRCSDIQYVRYGCMPGRYIKHMTSQPVGHWILLKPDPFSIGWSIEIEDVCMVDLPGLSFQVGE